MVCRRGIGAHHVESSVLGHEQNVRNIAAVLLVEMATLFRQVHGLAGGDVLQIHHRICHPALGADNQPSRGPRFCGKQGHKSAVFGDRKLQSTRDGAGPLHCSGDGGSIVDRNDLIVALGEEPGQPRESKKPTDQGKPAHTRPLKVFGGPHDIRRTEVSAVLSKPDFHPNSRPNLQEDAAPGAR